MGVAEHRMMRDFTIDDRTLDNQPDQSVGAVAPCQLGMACARAIDDAREPLVALYVLRVVHP
ncbi:MAG TPA: hypothetical protein VK607_18270 [Kofleriaceae bacterium]|nr:hypothetical protein [Kofleriaceae bacterium]